MRTARLGLIGTGFIGEVHLRALRHNARASVVNAQQPASTLFRTSHGSTAIPADARTIAVTAPARPTRWVG